MVGGRFPRAMGSRNEIPPPAALPRSTSKHADFATSKEKTRKTPPTFRPGFSLVADNHLEMASKLSELTRITSNCSKPLRNEL